MLTWPQFENLFTQLYFFNHFITVEKQKTKVISSVCIKKNPVIIFTDAPIIIAINGVRKYNLDYHKEIFTFFVRQCPGDDASHQTTVQQYFLREDVVSGEVPQVLPPVGSFDRCRHGFAQTVQIPTTNLRKRFLRPPASLQH